MIDASGTVMRTFNDYEEDSGIGFIRMRVDADSPWRGRALRDAEMPKEVLILLVLRGRDAVVPSGATVLEEGDVLVAAAPEFKGKDDFGMYEQVVGKKHKWLGKRLRELKLPSGTLVAMIKRGGEALVPRGDTLIRENDTVAILRIKDVADGEAASA